MTSKERTMEETDVAPGKQQADVLPETVRIPTTRRWIDDRPMVEGRSDRPAPGQEPIAVGVLGGGGPIARVANIVAWAVMAIGLLVIAPFALRIVLWTLASGWR
jgi:hypothetical protein